MCAPCDGQLVPPVVRVPGNAKRKGNIAGPSSFSLVVPGALSKEDVEAASWQLAPSPSLSHKRMVSVGGAGRHSTIQPVDARGSPRTYAAL
jgi:hypothetical protein